MKFNIINGVKTKSQLDEIISFFRNAKGCGNEFRFKDWTDYKAENQIIGVGDGKETNFQLIKSYKIGNNHFIRKIKKPVFATVKVFIDSQKIDDVNIDIEDGIIKFNEPPTNGAVIGATFEFDVPVRFDSDLLEIKMETINTGKIKDITLVEVL